jgi:hypothetical protein
VNIKRDAPATAFRSLLIVQAPLWAFRFNLDNVALGAVPAVVAQVATKTSEASVAWWYAAPKDTGFA